MVKWVNVQICKCESVYFFTFTSLHLFQLPHITSLHTSTPTATSGFPGLFLWTAASGGAKMSSSSHTCTFMAMYVHDHVSSWPCTFTTMYVHEHVLSGACAFMRMYIHDHVCSWPFIFMTIYIHNHGHSWRCMFMTMYVHDHVLTWPCKYMTM